MDIAEAKAGILKLDRQHIDVSILVQEVVDVYRFIAEEKEIVINTDLCMGLFVSADSNRMRQVLGNLLDNAVKYTPTGGRVNVQTRTEAGKVVITVKDTGIGICEKDITKIWDRLYRGDESRSQRGLGLGLSLVKSIVDIHGGYVDVSSEPGSGSTFTIYIPQSK